jgi:site-specific DNA-methyltransferase (adenine-specific)
MRSVLVHADCFDVFPYIADKSVNLILCDLPYGTTACKWDSVLPFDKLWEEYERIITDNGAIVLTASQPFTSALVMSNPKMFKYEVIWEKDKASNFMLAKKQIQKYHESILIFYHKNCTYNPIMWDAGKLSNIGGKADKLKKGGVTGNSEIGFYEPTSTLRYPKSVLKFNTPKSNDKENRCLHPTQKPLELIKYLIKTYSNEDDVVMDNCMGSNTTGLACKELNRQYIGIEKEKNYYDVSVSRVLS